MDTSAYQLPRCLSASGPDKIHSSSNMFCSVAADPHDKSRLTWERWCNTSCIHTCNTRLSTIHTYAIIGCILHMCDTYMLQEAINASLIIRRPQSGPSRLLEEALKASCSQDHHQCDHKQLTQQPERVDKTLSLKHSTRVNHRTALNGPLQGGTDVYLQV